MSVRRLCFNSILCLAIFFIVATQVFYISYRNDMQFLKSVVLTQINPSANLLESATHWVYQNKGFEKNHNFFLLPALGPTPIQVLEKGGDCADKSRLLMALFDSVEVDSSLIMLYDTDAKTPTHTVVEMRDKQLKAVADPVFDVVFPKSEHNYYTLQDLRKNSVLLPNRLDELIKLRGNENKVAFYKRSSETYQFATTINWNKNKILRFIAENLEKIGIEPSDVRRPHFLDDPKLFFAVTFFMGGLISAFFAWLIKEPSH